jgi:Cu/Ag efflux protein CusF
MKHLSPLIAVAVAASAAIAGMQMAWAQPAKGAAASFDRVREVTANRFKDTKLTGDPDQDFALMLLAHHENMIFLARTQLEFGGDRELRQAAQKILDTQEKQIADIKQWQVRNRKPDYAAQANQTPPGSDRQAQAAPASPPPTAQSAPQVEAAPARDLPLVSGTVEKVDVASGRITIDHAAIPNLNMDAMTMVFRTGDPAMLKQVKTGDKVRFSADRVNGQITVTKIQKGR